MSDTFGTRNGTSGDPAPAGAVHEAYSFACMKCGHCWEQAYEIAHHVDEHGHTHVVYYADARRVPSPLTRPSCANCGGHLVRIMRSGQVSSARWDRLAHPEHPEHATRWTRSAADSVFPAAGSLFASFTEYGGGDDEPARDTRREADSGGRPGVREPRPGHHWLAGFLALFHRHHAA